MRSSDTCSYLSQGVVRALAGHSTQVKLQVNENANILGGWTTTATSTNDAALTALTSSTGSWHGGASFDNWSWTTNCSPTLATGWPNMYQACGNGLGVHWLDSGEGGAYFHSSTPTGLGKRSATWLGGNRAP